MTSYTVTVSRDLAPQTYKKKEDAQAYASFWDAEVGLRMEYKGYVVETEDDPWPNKYGWFVRFYNDEHIHHAKNFVEAMEKINERVYGSN